ncbi:DMT family transporter [Desulfuribacillus stibiiarsenatis]|uniref:DMT family transporter n=1 Tax=Desulfuribacillus stibiiarsenatis TaxID=1390249 RepID=UPI000B2C9BC7|nr:EamA family transporter [Desulfuribacillus stibiiarsenatis]
MAPLSDINKTYISLILSTFIWGSAFIAAKVSVAVFHPFTVAFLRFFGASIVLWIVMTLREPNRPKLAKQDIITFTILGLVGIYGYNVLFFYGVMLAPVTKSSLMIATNPIFIAILSVIVLKEKLRPLQFLGVLLGIVGAFVIITNGSILSFFEAGVTKVDFILIGAVICWAIYSIVGKISLQRFSPLVSTTYACIAGTFFLFVFSLPQIMNEQYSNANITVWSAIVYMAVVVSALSFVLWYDGIRVVGAAKAASFINLMPISAVTLAVLIFGEKLSIYQFYGAVLIIIGVYLSNRKYSTKPLVNQEQNIKLQDS